jgi:hypothetical protein
MAGSFGYEKNIMTMQMGRILFQNKSTQQPLLQQQVPVAVIKF